MYARLFVSGMCVHGRYTPVFIMSIITYRPFLLVACFVFPVNRFVTSLVCRDSKVKFIIPFLTLTSNKKLRSFNTGTVLFN